jgi:8-oxo-dGTP pyrophosphatase MutT (NUDIX family)
MRQDRVKCAGGIVLGEGGTIALIRSENSDSWLFPKGHIDEGETEEQAARREIAEEAGLTDLELIDDLGGFTRARVSITGYEYEEKEVKMFLFAALPHAKLEPSMEIKEARWVPFREIPEVLGSPHQEWFARDRAWYASVAERVRQAIQRD